MNIESIAIILRYKIIALLDITVLIRQKYYYYHQNYPLQHCNKL